MENELRIGNLVKRNGIVVTIDHQTFYDVIKHPEQYERIPFTEYFSIKFLFKENPEWLDGFWLILEGDMCFRFYKNTFQLWDLQMIKVFYNIKVHEVMNLYFALTGKELKTK